MERQNTAQNIMEGLKDFQKETVNRIIQLYESGQKRVLISDEVGLGKTLIAGGTIAKFADFARKQGKKRISVVYICSNAAIADQNLEKLCITEDVQRESVEGSRLSIQHLNIFYNEAESAEENSVRLIPLTPDTSFYMATGCGQSWERAVLFAILLHIPELTKYIKPLERIMQARASAGWNEWAKQLGIVEVSECNRLTKGKYLKYMVKKVSKGLKAKNQDGNTLLDDLIKKCREVKKSRKVEDIDEIIGRLRYLFAGISLERLNPDLVILDEFQRFKYLIKSENDSEMGMLAGKFFNSKSVYMLLLSATPYKMYSTLEEIDESLLDEHFLEFFNVMDFLNNSDDKQREFKSIWEDYSKHLKEFALGDISIIQAKNKAQEAMYGSVCRTERISTKESADIMDITNTHKVLDVDEYDIKSYIKARRLVELMEKSYNLPIDYIKSCPYIMSFMKDYKLKKDVVEYFSDNPEKIKEIDKDTKDILWLKREDINNFKAIRCNNARLEAVKKHVFSQKSELLLWVPPSKPYYAPAGVFKDAENFSKTLIFSSWEMVPRMVSCMLSYEEERRTVGALAKNNEDITLHYFSSEKKTYPGARMKFSISGSRLNSMSLFCLLYPSRFLTECYNPIDCMNRSMSLKEIEKEIAEKISKKLEKYKTPLSGAIDQRWYYMAPLLLDPPGYVTEWLNWEEKKLSGEDDTDTSFSRHLKQLKQLFYNNIKNFELGRKPKDLYFVLANMAIASPAVCISRLYNAYVEDINYSSTLPTRAAKRFIDMMNKTDSTAIVELACGKNNEDAHWKNVLTYCKQGNIQAMLDEYAHLLSNGYKGENIVDKLHNDIIINIKTTHYEIDTWQNFHKTINKQGITNPRIRTHFAVAFTKGEGGEKDINRKKSVRAAFNSPFRPFVLTSTSIGQEGLDFHNYCRKIVHWNLPSNPIDLEQREGRINRFKCLAIRQNVAKRYGNIIFKSNIWEELFQEAKLMESSKKSSDLIPYWGLKETKDMIRIERIVPMYPLSKDQEAYERLIKILSLYRLTLGQARQEELLEYLIQNEGGKENLEELFMNLSPYFRKV